MSEEKEHSTFKVTDKRSFTEQGDVRPDAEARREVRKEEGEDPPASFRPEEELPRTDPREEEAAGIDFSSFVISLGTTAMVHMGEVPTEKGGPQENLDAAKQMIDILGMLQEKTSGNLTAEEARLVQDLLYELRMRFLAKRKVVQF